MATAKLTKKQIVLTLLLKAVYFFMSPIMGRDDPRRMEVEELLNEADEISGNLADVIQRKASHLGHADCRHILEYIESGWQPSFHDLCVAAQRLPIDDLQRLDDEVDKTILYELEASENL